MWRQIFPTCPLCGRAWDEHTWRELRAERKATNDDAARSQGNTAELWVIIRASAADTAERRAALRGASEDEIKSARQAAIQRTRDEEIASRAEARAIVRARFALAAERRAELDHASEAQIAAARRAALRWIRKVQKRDR